MVLNRREKIIAATLGGVILLFAGDRYLLTPYLEARARVGSDTEIAVTRLEGAERLFSNRRRVEQAWRDLQAAGLQSDPAAAESQSLHALRDWAQNARLQLQTLKTDRAIRAGDFLQIRLQVSGIGGTGSLAQFLQSVETSPQPLRINEFRANARKEGADDIAFTMTVSTLAYSPEPPKTTPTRPNIARPAAQEARR